MNLHPEDCPYCDGEIMLDLGFHNLSNTVVCPHCEETSIIAYDEQYDDDDIWDFFYLEKINQ